MSPEAATWAWLAITALTLTSILQGIYAVRLQLQLRLERKDRERLKRTVELLRCQETAEEPLQRDELAVLEQRLVMIEDVIEKLRGLLGGPRG